MNIWTHTIKWAVRCPGYQQQPQFTQRLLAFFSVLQYVAVCCSMLQCVAQGYEQQPQFAQHLRALSCVLQRVAVCCSVALLQKMTYKDKAFYDAMPPCTRIW